MRSTFLERFFVGYLERGCLLVLFVGYPQQALCTDSDTRAKRNQPDVQSVSNIFLENVFWSIAFHATLHPDLPRNAVLPATSCRRTSCWNSELSDADDNDSIGSLAMWFVVRVMMYVLVHAQIRSCRGGAIGGETSV